MIDDDSRGSNGARYFWQLSINVLYRLTFSLGRLSRLDRECDQHNFLYNNTNTSNRSSFFFLISTISVSHSHSHTRTV